MRMRLFVAIVLAVSLAAAGCGSGSDETPEVGDGSATTSSAATETDATSAAVTTTAVLPVSSSSDADDVNVDPAIAAVMAAIDALNSYDLDGWLVAHEGGERQGVPLFAEQILMNSKQQYEIVEACQVTGEDSSGKTSVVCVIKDNNEYWGVGGISDTKSQVYLVNADGLITNTNHFGSSSRDAFNISFHQWLSDTYPEVYNGMGYVGISSNGPGFDTKNPDHMLIAVEYVEGFVAQSDTYPLDP